MHLYAILLCPQVATLSSQIPPPWIGSLLVFHRANKASLNEAMDFWPQIFFIQFNIHLEENDQKELLDWFQELTVPAAKDTTQPNSDTKAAQGSRERYPTAHWSHS